MNNYTTIQNEYATWLNTLGFAASVCYDYKHRARDFFEWVEHTQGVSHISSITPKHIEIYFAYLQTRPNKRRPGGISVAHLNHNFIAIDKLCECLHQMGMSSAPTPTNYRIKPDKEQRIKNIQPFTAAEIQILYNCIPDTYPGWDFISREQKHHQLKLIFALYYGCGLRRTEGLKLRIPDIDFDKKTIFIKQGKGYKDRIVPMNTGVCKAIEHYVYNFRNLQKAKHNRLFIQGENTLTRSLNHLQEICGDEAIKSKRIYLHLLRHSIATHLLQNGMAVESIALFLGHSSLESTQIYTHFI